MRKLVAKLAKLDAEFELTFFGRFNCRTKDHRITIHNRRFDKAEFDELIPQYDYILQPYLDGSNEAQRLEQIGALSSARATLDALNASISL